MLHLMAFTPTSPEADAALQAIVSSAAVGIPDRGERIRRGETFTSRTSKSIGGVPALLEVARLRGLRSMLFVPLLREGSRSA